MKQSNWFEMVLTWVVTTQSDVIKQRSYVHTVYSDFFNETQTKGFTTPRSTKTPVVSDPIPLPMSEEI